MSPPVKTIAEAPGKPLPRLRVWFRRLSLRWAVALAVAVGLLVPGLYSVWHEIDLAEQQATARLRNDVSTLAEVLAVVMREPIWQVSPELGRHIAQSMFRDPRLVSITVRTEDGQAFIEVYRSVKALSATMSEQRSIVMSGRKIGLVEIALTVAEKEEELVRLLRQSLLRTGLVLAVSLMLILAVLDRWMLGPVAIITRSASRLAEKRLESPMRLDRSDELGDLAQALEKMRLALRDAFVDLERKNSELQAYATTLETRVEQRTLDLTESNERLSSTVSNLRAAQNSLIEAEKLASLGRLVASITHELNTPLGNAMTVVTALEDSHRVFAEKAATGTMRRSELDHFVKHNADGLEILHRNVARASTLMASFKQVAVDQSSERRRAFDLAAVIQETISTLQPKLKRTPYVIECRVPEGIMMDSYPGPLEQVLINLIMNSVIHGFGDRPYGLITLTSELLERDRVRIVCSDDGVGMTEVVRMRAFEPFFSTRHEQGGSGLGMNVVYSMITGVLGGKVSLRSRPGEGTACIIDLPLDAPEYVAGQT